MPSVKFSFNMDAFGKDTFMAYTVDDITIWSNAFSELGKYTIFLPPETISDFNELHSQVKDFMLWFDGQKGHEMSVKFFDSDLPCSEEFALKYFHK